MTLRVWPAQTALDEQLVRQLAPGAACVSGAASASDETWEGFWGRFSPAAADPDPVVARLALRAACARVDLGPFAAMGGARGFLGAAATFIADVERAAVGAGEVATAAAAVEGPVGERLRALARVYSAAARGAVDSAERRRGAVLRALRDGRNALPVTVTRDVEIMTRLMWEPADVELVLALARRLRGKVIVHLAWSAAVAGKASAFAGTDAILAAFEARADLTNLELVLEDPRAAATAPRSLLAAASPAAELRAVAAHVRGLVDSGVAPEEIAVAARSPGVVAELLADELERVGLGLDGRRPPPLGSAPVARLALALLALPGRGYLREETLAALGSTYVAGSMRGAAGARRARVLGLRDLGPANRARLDDAWLSEKLALVDALPARSDVGEHAGALAWLLKALLGSVAVEAAAPRVERAIGRDQVAAQALLQLLDGLPSAARAAGFTATLTREGFAAVLADLMADAAGGARGVRGGAPRLVHLADLGARRFAHLVVVGLVDGEAPARASEDGVYGDDERRALNRALGRRVLPTADGGERTPFEHSLLEHALSVADDSVLLTHAQLAGDRPATRSPFLDELAATGRVLARSPVPGLDDAAAANDVLTRVALEAWADPAGRMPPAPPLAAAPLVELLRKAMPERAARVEALAGLERARWQAGTGAGPEVVVGEVAGLAARVGGTAESPLSAGQLDKLANCGWSFFAARVLGVVPVDENGDAPSPKSTGFLAHRCLELFYRARLAADRLPVTADEDDRRALQTACDAVFAETRPTGHPGLWQLAREKLVESLWRWVTHEAAEGAPGGGVPAEFELEFGAARPGSLPALVFDVDGTPLHLGGRLDRVDCHADGGAIVVDYKLGAQAPQRAKLGAKKAGQLALQLPIYAAALRVGLPGVTRVDAAFVSLKDSVATKTLREVLGNAETDALLGEALPARVAELGRMAWRGALAARPVDCTNCPYRTVCRVVAVADDEEGEA